MKKHSHDEPAKGSVSQKEYDYALKQLREFQAALGHWHNKQNSKA